MDDAAKDKVCTTVVGRWCVKLFKFIGACFNVQYKKFLFQYISKNF